MKQEEFLVAVATVPSILWLFWRFSTILRNRRRKIWHHVQHPGQSSKPSAVSFVLHILLGLTLLAAAPYAALQCVPPTSVDVHEQGHGLFNALLAIALLAVNGSVLCLLPHPSQYRAYGCSTSREIVRGLSPLYASSLSFFAMALTTTAFLVNFIKISIFIMIICILIYGISNLICICELLRYPWERHVVSNLFFKNLLGRGPKQKSRLTQVYVRFDPAAYMVAMTAIVAPGIWGLVQCCCMLVCFVVKNNNNNNPSRQQENFFIVAVLYMTLVMSAGFFTQAQAYFEQQEIDEKKGHKNSTNPSMMTIIWFDLLLTQIWPMFLLVVGPSWIGAESAWEFMYQWNFWTGPS